MDQMENEQTNTQSGAQEQGAEAQSQQRQRKGRAKKPLTKQPVFWVIVIIVILLIGAGAYVAMMQDGSQPSQNGDNTTQNNTDNGGVVASVNGSEIPVSEFESQYQQQRNTLEQRGLNLDEQPQLETRIKSQVVQNLVDRELLLQYADRQNIEVSDQEVQSNIDQISGQFQNQQQFQQVLEERGISQDEFRSNVREQLRVQNAVDQQMNGENATVTNQEVQDAYDRISQQATNTPPLEQVREQLRSRLEQQKQGQAMQQLTQQLRENANISINEEYQFETQSPQQQLQQIQQQQGQQQGTQQQPAREQGAN
jgi:FKBP-type peptidyl-prolyl cis-trans isomerase (trigger factor)